MAAVAIHRSLYSYVALLLIFASPSSGAPSQTRPLIRRQSNARMIKLQMGSENLTEHALQQLSPQAEIKKITRHPFMRRLDEAAPEIKKITRHPFMRRLNEAAMTTDVTTTITNACALNGDCKHDNWNVASNWDSGVPSGSMNAVVSSSLQALVNNDATPTYTGQLTLQSNAVLRICHVCEGVGPANAVKDVSEIKMEAGSMIISNLKHTLDVPPITLLGNAEYATASTGAHWKQTHFTSISGAHDLTLYGCNGHEYHLNGQNTFANLISDANGRHRIRAKASGSLGMGDVTINGIPTTGQSAQLYLDVADTIADTARLTLNGKGWDPATSDRITIAGGVTETVGALVVDGVEIGEGTYDKSEDWLSGDGILIVDASGVAAVPNTSTCDSYQCVNNTLNKGAGTACSQDACDEATCCMAFGVSDSQLHCSARNVCVKEFLAPAGPFQSFDEFFTFECKCVHRGIQLQYSHHCSEWIACMENHSESIQVHIEASLVRLFDSHWEAAAINDSLVQLSQSNDCTCSTPPCYNPRNKSAAASLLECDCLPDLAAACGSPLVRDAGECLADFACNHTHVCDAWKGSFCTNGTYWRPGTLTTLLEMRGNSEFDRAQRFDHSASTIESEADDKFDLILEGKCR